MSDALERIPEHLRERALQFAESEAMRARVAYRKNNEGCSEAMKPMVDKFAVEALTGKMSPMWDPKKARRALDDEINRRAKGRGMSDSTLSRLAYLASPEASTGRRAFETALVRSGMSQRRACDLGLAVRDASIPLMRRVLRAVVRAGRRLGSTTLVVPICIAFVMTGWLPLLFAATFVLVFDGVRRRR